MKPSSHMMSATLRVRVVPVEFKPPVIDRRLVEYLECVFPDRCPDPQFSEKEVWIAAGSAQVVRHLRFILEEQEKTVLEN